MPCTLCEYSVSLDWNFCPSCGENLVKRAMKEQYKNGYGSWEVTTEGDCEGRSTRHLGTHIGYIDEIAFRLAGQAYYSLNFTPAAPLPRSAVEVIARWLELLGIRAVELQAKSGQGF